MKGHGHQKAGCGLIGCVYKLFDAGLSRFLSTVAALQSIGVMMSEEWRLCWTQVEMQGMEVMSEMS